MANDRIIAKRGSRNLNFLVKKKIIHRLLTEERIKTSLDEGIIKGTEAPPVHKVIAKPYTKEELAKKLDISLEDLENFILVSSSSALYESMAEQVDKISLSLTRLYCSIKFVSGEYKDEHCEKSEEI